MAYNKQQSGFALLISLVVVGAVLSIGLVILDLSIKQVRLAATTKDSEIAFHAANAGKECGMYWRRQENDQMINGAQTAIIDCFGEIADDVSGSANSNVSGTGRVSDGATAAVDDTADGDAYVYEYEFTWNGGERCSSITTVVATAAISGNGVSVTNMRTLVPGYPESTSLDCPAGAQCTVLAVQGYNKACSQKANYGTIQREILLKF